MPIYQVKCKKCGKKHEIFTQTIKQADSVFKGLNFICPICNIEMEKVIFPSLVDMEGWVKKT